MVSPILTTKLYIPQPRTEFVPRPRLIERLNEGLRQNLGFGRKLTLISAPAGFGKTTLVSHWLQQLAGEHPSSGTPKGGSRGAEEQEFSPAPFVWLSLDEADNDPIRFLTYFVAALGQIDQQIGQTAQQLLHAEQVQSLLPDSFMTILINDIVATSIKFTLILDDYHTIENKTIHAALTFLLDNLPPEMHLTMISRTDPPLPLSRWRARGQLLELRADDLSFTLEETAMFLNTVMGFNLTAEDIAVLEARTEGWITGLQLAALSMQGQQNKSNFIATFTGKDRFIVDYLLEEVFQGQLEYIQTFLLQTSILDRLTGPLCDAVLGKDETENLHPSSRFAIPHPSSFILEQLERANLFIVPLDNERQWYRYQQLFGEFLRGRLQQNPPPSSFSVGGTEGIAELHRRAAQWYAQNGLFNEAIGHALAAPDVEHAAVLIEHATDPTLKIRGEATTFLGWLEALPDPVVHARPRLCLAKAWALFYTGQWPQVEPLLQQVELTLANATNDLAATPTTAAEVREIQGEMAALRAELALFQENTDQALALSTQALTYLPPENLRLRSMATQVQGFTYRLQGEVAKASQVLAEAGALSQAAGNLTFAIFALSDLAEVQVMQGQLRQAARTFQHIMNLASEQRAWPFPPTGLAYIGIGNLLCEWNDLDTAAQHLYKGIELSQKGGYIGVASQGYLILAQVKQAQGESDQALDLLRQVEKLVSATGSHRLRARLALTRVRLGLRQGEVTAAAQWARDYEQSQAGGGSSLAYQRQLEQTTLARVRLAQGQPDVTLLERLLQTAERADWQQNMIELLALQALALEALGETAKAITTMKRALTLAEPEGYIRLFIDEGPPMAKLLRLVIAQGILPTYVGQLQASFMPAVSEQAVSPQALIDPLTERELTVLQLMAAGLSNQAIADELVLALGTVARYTNNIFTKLNVRNRTQAILRAKVLGLI